MFQLRRVEHNLAESDRRAMEDALVSGRAEHTVAVDRVPSYRVDNTKHSSNVSQI